MDEQELRIAVNYTLSASAIQLADPPPETRRTPPQYPLAPVILLGRLAIDREYQDQHLGEALLFDAVGRVFDVGTREVATVAAVVDALHERAGSFYERYGFQRFPDNEHRLFLPIQTIRQVLEEEDVWRQ